MQIKTKILWIFFFFSFLPLLLHGKKSFSVLNPIVGYSLANTLKVSGSFSRHIAGSSSYKANAPSNGAAILGVEGVKVYPINDEYYWGIGFSASYEMKRKFETDLGLTREVMNDKFSIFNIDFTGRFYFDEGFYLLGGFGFPQPNDEDGDGSSKSSSRSGGIAWIGGLGWSFSEVIIFEVQYRSYRFSYEEETLVGTKLKQDESLSGLTAFIKVPLLIL